MLLVILGAGASFDSAPSMRPNDIRYGTDNKPNRPPLANELFSNRPYFGQTLQKYPKCLDIAPRLRLPPPNTSIETILQRYQSEASGDSTHRLERMQQLASVRYYIQEIISGCTSHWVHDANCVLNHMQLFDDIRFWMKKNEQVCFVTFNYDRLMEIPLAYANVFMTSFADYISNDIILIKLHGSVNWGRVVATPIDLDKFNARELLSRELIRRCGELNISHHYVMAAEQFPERFNNHAVFPALAIPVEEKIGFECPPEHVKKLRSFIPKITKILCIGWRATEKPFLDLLKQGLEKGKKYQIMIVNGGIDDCVATDTRLTRCGILGEYRVHPEGFSDFVVSDKLREFLNS